MKNIIKTKTFWAGAGSIITGIGMIIIGDKTTGLQLLFTGFSTIFMRSAINKIQK